MTSYRSCNKRSLAASTPSPARLCTRGGRDFLIPQRRRRALAAKRRGVFRTGRSSHRGPLMPSIDKIKPLPPRPRDPFAPPRFAVTDVDGSRYELSSRAATSVSHQGGSDAEAAFAREVARDADVETFFDRSIVEAARALADANVAMDARFSALFRLRSLGTDDAVRALVERLDREREASALMRHEVAFALGQMGATGAIEALCETLADSSENGMVRHECAEALGALGSEHARCVEALRRACVDEKREVAETAALALRKLERHGREMSGSARGSAKERASASVETA